jgi:hypothetical protein
VGLFGSVVTVIFQSIFSRKYIKIIFFLFFKNLFLISAYQNNLQTLKKKNQIPMRSKTV